MKVFFFMGKCIFSASSTSLESDHMKDEMYKNNLFALTEQLEFYQLSCGSIDALLC